MEEPSSKRRNVGLVPWAANILSISAAVASAADPARSFMMQQMRNFGVAPDLTDFLRIKESPPLLNACRGIA